MTKVLVSDPIDQAGIEILRQVAQVDENFGLSLDDLRKIIGEYDALMIRSGTQVNEEVGSKVEEIVNISDKKDRADAKEDMIGAVLESMETDFPEQEKNIKSLILPIEWG